jgi:hypothetical protein
MATPVKHILSSLLTNQEDWRIMLLQKWDTIMGGLKTRIRLEKITDDTLVIGVYEAHWMQELFLLSRVITNTVNKALDKPRITQLRFKLVEEKKKIKREKKSPDYTKPVSIQEIKLNRQQQLALDQIKDVHLQQVLKQFLARCSQN